MGMGTNAVGLGEDKDKRCRDRVRKETNLGLWCGNGDKMLSLCHCLLSYICMSDLTTGSGAADWCTVPTTTSHLCRQTSATNPYRLREQVVTI